MKALEQLKNNLDQENQAMNNHWRQIQIYLGKKKRAIQNDSTPNKTRNERYDHSVQETENQNKKLFSKETTQKSIYQLTKKYQQEINQLKEEIKLLKHTKKYQQEEAKVVKTWNAQKNFRPMYLTGWKRKYRTDKYHKLYQTSHGNFLK